MGFQCVSMGSSLPKTLDSLLKPTLELYKNSKISKENSVTRQFDTKMSMIPINGPVRAGSPYRLPGDEEGKNY